MVDRIIVAPDAQLWVGRDHALNNAALQQPEHRAAAVGFYQAVTIALANRSDLVPRIAA
jgi:hypothetical protein